MICTLASLVNGQRFTIFQIAFLKKISTNFWPLIRKLLSQICRQKSIFRAKLAEVFFGWQLGTLKVARLIMRLRSPVRRLPKIFKKRILLLSRWWCQKKPELFISSTFVSLVVATRYFVLFCLLFLRVVVEKSPSRIYYEN